MYPIEAKQNTKYLWYYMLSDDFLEQAFSAGSRSVLPKINQKEMAKLVVPLPSTDEQTEIVRILDVFMDMEEKARALCDLISNIELMKKAILARAFRGELGTNDPQEESALELLKAVLAQ
jgi:type I restriction enzyme S subunit